MQRRWQKNSIKEAYLRQLLADYKEPIPGARERVEKVLRVIHQAGQLPEKEICYLTGVGAPLIRRLVTLGILQSELVQVSRMPQIKKTDAAPELVLNDSQQAAYDRLCALQNGGMPEAALLYGVTGSGKTLVYIKLIQRTLEMGKNAILLVPEIALTPQMLQKFRLYFGTQVAVMHSGLTAAQRYDEYCRIQRGQARVVIGTRTAVFAPLTDLGCIILDEEQEHTYKSDMSPKYHAKDIARYRSAHQNSLMLLASATPSFDSYYKAKEGKYALVTLKNRYGGAKLPRVSVVDMRKSAAGGVTSPLGNMLCEKLVETKELGNQSILFINRRGYNNFLSCRSCGEAVSCPTCSVSMTYHTYGGSYDRGELRCHWCGRRMPVPTTCPSCQSEHIARMGYGTQRIEQELSELLPSAQILRMDTDTTSAKNAYEELLGKFRRREADILLGTQMVTKGHDFPAVTLVGVLLADASLYLDDYRAAERTFAMLTQVIGRAGRADKEGEAIIQTNNPDNDCIRLACKQDYERFYENEIRLRKQLRFPPFCDIALMTLSSNDEKELMKASGILSKNFETLAKGEYSDLPLMTFGPFEAPVYKVDNKYRMRMVVKCKLNKRSRAMFSSLLSDFSRSGAKGLNLSIDFNPSNL